MIRRALIIYCNETQSGELFGPPIDNQNFFNFLTSSLGGNWFREEIYSLQNPSSVQVENSINSFLNGADYTFIIFTGHGFINLDSQKQQYVELINGGIPILNLRTTAKRQTLIVDACRGFFSPTREVNKVFGDVFDHFTGKTNTRKIFDNAVLYAEEGWTILYAANRNQTALDTVEGAAYLLSLLEVAENWGVNNKIDNILPINVAHQRAKIYLSKNFETIQEPSKNAEKRIIHFPFAVKMTLINS